MLRVKAALPLTLTLVFCVALSGCSERGKALVVYVLLTRGVALVSFIAMTVILILIINKVFNHRSRNSHRDD